MIPDEKYEMLYCDTPYCRVNTFERGDGSDHLRGWVGMCPGCNREGVPLT